MAGKKDDLNLGKGKGKVEEEKGGKGRLILIVIAVLVLAGGGAGAFLFLSGDDAGGDDTATEPAEGVEEQTREPLYLDMKKLLVNVEYEGRTHYVQAEMQLMSYSQEVIDQAFRDRPAIRDRLIMLFSGQDFGALKTVEGKEALRAAALSTVNETLGLSAPKAVEEVYFENFVLQ